MYALKALGLFETTSVSQSSWGELLKERIGKGNSDEKLRKLLVKSNVADVDAAVDAINWLHLFDDVPLGSFVSTSSFLFQLLTLSLSVYLSVSRNKHSNRCSLEPSRRKVKVL
jgi:hypothetical protein